MSGRPGIYIEDLTRNTDADRHYAVLGRALWLATRFERACRTLAVLLGANGVMSSTVDADPIQQLENFAATVQGKNLNGIILHLAGKKAENYLANALHAAREARNLIAHEIALGFDQTTTSEGSTHAQYEVLTPAVLALAEADKVLSFIISIRTGEPILVGEAEKNYINDVTGWVLGTTHAEPPNSR